MREQNLTQTALPIVLDRWELKGSNAAPLVAWLDAWKAVDGVRLLASTTDVIVVDAGSVLELDDRTRLYRVV